LGSRNQVTPHCFAAARDAHAIEAPDHNDQAHAIPNCSTPSGRESRRFRAAGNDTEPSPKPRRRRCNWTSWKRTIVGAILFELRMSPAFRVRGYRMAVRITSDAVYVHGYFLTRRVERAAITAVTNDPAIEWLDAAGRTLRTPMRVFNTAPGSFGAVGRRLQQRDGRSHRKNSSPSTERAPTDGVPADDQDEEQVSQPAASKLCTSHPNRFRRRQRFVRPRGRGPQVDTGRGIVPRQRRPTQRGSAQDQTTGSAEFSASWSS
jgi:hypothetical protein